MSRDKVIAACDAACDALKECDSITGYMLVAAIDEGDGVESTNLRLKMSNGDVIAGILHICKEVAASDGTTVETFLELIRAIYRTKDGGAEAQKEAERVMRAYIGGLD